MSAVYVRRWLFDPGADVLLNIESVNILDLDPPAAIKGIGTGTVLCIGEFENGAFATPVEIASTGDFVKNGGTLGYTYSGVVGNYPCAIARKSDNAVTPEWWNGNGYIQLTGKQFGRLVLCRVDTSVGSVNFTPMAFVTGAAQFRYALAAGQVLGVDLGGSGGAGTATFSATAATVTSAAATYAVNPGDQVTLGYDGAPNFTVTFLSGDSTQANVIARINQYAGFAFAATATGQFSLTGIQKGNQAQVRVVSASSGGVLTALGLTAATTFGTGNVGNIAAVTPQEVVSVVQAGIAGTQVDIDPNGALRISNTSTAAGNIVLITSATTATGLGFSVGQFGTILGVAMTLGASGTFAMATNDQVTLQVDQNAPVTVTFQNTDTTVALCVTRINNAFTSIGTVAYNDGGQLRLTGLVPGGKVAVLSVSSPSVFTKLGLSAGTNVGTPLPVGPVIPAGTVVQVPNGQVFVTMQDVSFSTNGITVAGTGPTPTVQPTFGPYVVKVRHALDDGSGLSASAGAITSIVNVPTLGSFTVINPAPTTAALTEAQIDAQYVAAIGATTDINTVAKQVNISFSARQSGAVRRAMKQNALTASAQGCFGRVTCIRTPMNTLKTVALSTNAEPGVGAYRDQRVFFCYPQGRAYVPLIARRGVNGNPAGTTYAAFSPDGNVDVGADGFLAAVLSQLPPEENPGQENPFLGGLVAIESGANAQGFQMQDYINFKAAGIVALRFDDGAAIFQSGVTSVDPSVYPQLTRISRRRMADFIQDSLAQRAKAFGKKLSTNARRKAFSGEVRAFMDILLNKNNPQGQRIAGYTLDSITGNTQQSIGAGRFRQKLAVRTLASLDSIELEITVGEQVQVQEQLPALAA